MDVRYLRLLHRLTRSTSGGLIGREDLLKGKRAMPGARVCTRRWGRRVEVTAEVAPDAGR